MSDRVNRITTPPIPRRAGSDSARSMERAAEAQRGHRRRYSGRMKALALVLAPLAFWGAKEMAYNYGEGVGHPGVSAEEKARQDDAIKQPGVDRLKGFYCNISSGPDSAKMVGNTALVQLTAIVGNAPAGPNSPRFLAPEPDAEHKLGDKQAFLARWLPSDIVPRDPNARAWTVLLSLVPGTSDGIKPILVESNTGTRACSSSIKVQHQAGYLALSYPGTPKEYERYDAFPRNPSDSPTASPTAMPSAVLPSQQPGNGPLTMPASPTAS